MTRKYTAEDICDTPAGGDYEITYITPAIGIAFARALGGSIADIYFTGRIFNLFTFCALVCITLKLLPFKKKSFFTIIFMPMLLVLASVYSADSTAFGLISIFIAYCLKLAYQNEKIDIKQLIILAVTFLLMCIAKGIAYIFIGLILFILPIKKIFKDNKNNKKYILMLLLIVFAIVILLFVNTYKAGIYNGGDPRSEGTNTSKQLQYILNNPIQYVKVLWNHFIFSFGNIRCLSYLYGPMFFGSEYYTLVFSITLPLILLVGVLDNKQGLNIKTKIIFLLTFLIEFAFTSTSMYLSYTKVGSSFIDGYQMRYLFPILPLILTIISINKFKYNEEKAEDSLIITSLIGVLMIVSFYLILTNIV